MKISLAVAAALVAALGLYYGVFRSGPESADLDTASADATKIPAKTVQRPKRIAAPTPDSAIGGILRESIAQATAPRGSTMPVSTSTARPADPLETQGPPAPTSTRYIPLPVTTRENGPRPSAATPQLATYQVKAGDSMSSIALAWFGDATRWQLIANANPGVNPLQLQIGQTLKLPARSTASTSPATTTATTTPPARSGRRTHVVRAGDNLSWIADRYYGDIGKWSVIYKANRGVIGSDPDTLAVGTKLLIPDA